MSMAIAIVNCFFSPFLNWFRFEVFIGLILGLLWLLDLFCVSDHSHRIYVSFCGSEFASLLGSDRVCTCLNFCCCCLCRWT